MRKSKYGYLWVTLALFLISIIGQWVAGWFEYKKEQEEHQQPVETKDYVIEMTEGHSGELAIRVSPTGLAGCESELSVVRWLATIERG
jgi:hypothetical protein